MDYRILGPLEVIDEGESIDIGSRQQRCLLALLLLNANRTVSTARILEELWRDDPTGKERTLWVYISRLRAVLEPGREAHSKGSVLLTMDRGYSLALEDSAVDAHRFEELVTAGHRLLKDDPDEAARLLDDGLGLWRGSALEDFRYEEFAQADAARLDELRLVALEDRIDAHLRALRHRSVIGELEKLVVDHPNRERLVSLQMIALYRSGRQADALRAFERYRMRIDEELGIVPSPELRRIEEQVLLHDARLTPPADPERLDTSTVVVNPFKGLQAFAEADAPTFFGRDGLVTDLVRRISGGARLLALVGASGSGKSSLLNAGLLPAIRKGAIDGSDEWLIAPMVPGSRPFRELEAALLRSTLDGPDSLADLLDDPEDGVLRACLRMLPEPSRRVLFVIDQFEELFTLGATTDERDRFVRNLEVVLDDAYGRVVVAIGLRADFYGRPLEYPRFAQLLGEGIVNVSPMAPDELESAAEQPAELAGMSLEPALVVQLLGDIAGQVGGLPLFQYALTELFDRRTESVLTLDSYHAMGGVSGALARRAEDLFLGLDADERHATKQLFLRLVTIVEQGAWSRRRVTATEIVTIAADLVALQAVVERFGAQRLLTFDRDLVSGSPTVEVAHEALLVEWPRLRRWIDEGQQDVLRHARLTIALAEWTAAGENVDYLLSGERLADYAGWAAVSTLELSRDEERFLDASILHRKETALAEEVRHAREIKLDRQARTRLWGLAIGAALIVTATVGAFLVFAGGGQPAIAVVHGASDDFGINAMMISGAGLAEGTHDIEVDLKPPLVDPEEHLRSLAESGTDLIIVGSDFNLDLVVDRIAPSYPDVRWVAIDPAAIHVEAPNITEIHFAVEDSAYLAGAAAALTSTTGRIGFIGGFQSFRTESSRSGFEQGAAAERSDVEVVSKFIGPIPNPLVDSERSERLAFDLATEMYADDIDVIFHDAGAAGGGVLRAAAARSASNDHVWTIGSDADEYYTVTEERSFILTSTVKRFDTAVQSAITAYLADDLTAGETTLGLDDAGVELSRSGGHLDGIDARLKNLEGDVNFGHIAVSPHVSRPPEWQTEPDVTVQLTLSDTGCEIGSIVGASVDGERLPVERGATILFELTNTSTNNGGFALREVPASVSLGDLLRESRSGIPTSFGNMRGITVAEIGAETNGAAQMTGTPIVPNCMLGAPGGPDAMFFPLIVSPI